MKRPPALLVASTEALLYQGRSPLYQELTGVYHDVLAGDSAALARVAKIITHYTKIAVTVHAQDWDGYDVAVYFYPIDVNHVLRDRCFEKEGDVYQLNPLSALLKSGKGSVNAKGGVDGVFTLFPAQIWVSKGMVDGTFTAEELAAMTLHEVGHIYSYFDTLGRTTVTSLAIAETQKALSATVDLEQRTHVVENTVKFLQLDGVDAGALAAPGEERAFEYIVIRNTVAKLSADQGQPKLFGGEIEFLADSYAVRMGAAKPLTSAHFKMAHLNRNIQARDRSNYVIVEGVKVACLLVAALSPQTLLIGALIASLCIACGRNDLINRDTPLERLAAVHGDLVALLKDRSLPRERVNELLLDAQFVSSLRETLTEHSTLVTYLWLTLSPSRRKLYKQIALQRQIGDLVNNDIFVHAAALKALNRRD
jgi:hypothetical protein